MLTKVSRNYSALGLSLLRVFAGILLWQQGAQSVFGWLGGDAAATFSPLWMLAVMELTGATLIILGLLTRPVALVLLVDMAAVYAIEYMPKGFWAVNNQGAMSLQYLVIFLVLVTVGSGAIAVDSLSPQLQSILKKFDRFAPEAHSIFRVVTGFMFWQSGAVKFGILEGRVFHFPEIRFFAGVMEFFGGLLLILGLWTRPVAFLLSGEMAVAFWGSRLRLLLDGRFWPIEGGPAKAVLFCFAFLYMVTIRENKWSLDWWLRRRSKTHPEAVSSSV